MAVPVAAACSHSDAASSASPESTQAAQTTPTGPPAKAKPTRAEAQATSEDMLRLVVPAPTWRVSDAAPAKRLDQPVQTYGDQADSVGFWTTSDSAEDTAGWIKGHVPPGYVLDVTGESHIGDSTENVQMLGLHPDPETAGASERQVVFALLPTATGTAIRVDAEVARSQTKFGGPPQPS